jgi:hypothetical protein
LEQHREQREAQREEDAHHPLRLTEKPIELTLQRQRLASVLIVEVCEVSPKHWDRQRSLWVFREQPFEGHHSLLQRINPWCCRLGRRQRLNCDAFEHRDGGFRIALQQGVP